MITTYIPPRHWWQREHSIRITVWPAWLAQRLCDHDGERDYMTRADIVATVCKNCGKCIWK